MFRKDCNDVIFNVSDCKHPRTAEDFLKSTPSKVFITGFLFFSFLIICSWDSLMLVGCSENVGKLNWKIEILNLG